MGKKNQPPARRPSPQRRTCGICGGSYDPTNDAQSRQHAKCVERAREEREGK